VKCQATRSRSQNEKIARSLLADKVEVQEKGDQSRVALKAEAARRKKASKVKKARRKYRDLEKGGEEGLSGDLEGEEVDVEVEDGDVNVEERKAENGSSEKGRST
jgi:protein subunit release factor B